MTSHSAQIQQIMFGLAEAFTSLADDEIPDHHFDDVRLRATLLAYTTHAHRTLHTPIIGNFTMNEFKARFKAIVSILGLATIGILITAAVLWLHMFEIPIAKQTTAFALIAFSGLALVAMSALAVLSWTGVVHIQSALSALGTPSFSERLTRAVVVTANTVPGVNLSEDARTAILQNRDLNLKITAIVCEVMNRSAAHTRM